MSESRDALIRQAAELVVDNRELEAIPILRGVIARDDSSVEARYWLAKALYHAPGDWGEAKHFLDEALQIDPIHPGCLTLHVELLFEFDRPVAEYWPDLELALVRGGLWPTTRYQRALAHAYLGRFDEALAEIAVARVLQAGMLSTPMDPVEQYVQWVVHGFSDTAAWLIDQLEERIARSRRGRWWKRLLGRADFRFERRSAKVRS